MHFVDGEWITGKGKALVSYNPADGKEIWQGNIATKEEVDQAVMAAREAFRDWESSPLKTRIHYLNAFHEALKAHEEELAEAISKETGKPLWESRAEVGSMVGKIAISIEAYAQRCPSLTRNLPHATSMTRHKPHGVLTVLGPFNLPGHLPNGHIVPALLAGNTVVFKPSELTPLVAEKTMQCWEESELPKGVLNMLQGDSTTGHFLAAHGKIDGLLFTGNVTTGKQLALQFSNHPEKILALEMGGNNPLLLGEITNAEAAAYLTIQSAYITSGQRCSCARRLIVPKGKTEDAFLKALCDMISHIRVGSYKESPEPFMGPVISEKSAKHLLNTQSFLKKKGGTPLVEMHLLKPHTPFLSPGLIDVTDISERPDEEFFGPLLQVIRVDNFDAAIQEANNTAYGLAAGLLSDNEKQYHKFYQNIRAGIINWNTSLTGASSAAPFGGVGCSGNHRPSAYYAADYCAYPVASMENKKLQKPLQLTPGIGDRLGDRL